MLQQPAAQIFRAARGMPLPVTNAAENVYIMKPFHLSRDWHAEPKPAIFQNARLRKRRFGAAAFFIAALGRRLFHRNPNWLAEP